jgi:multiple sugar transport system ATP-binding protein
MGSEVYLYLNTGRHAFIARVDAHDTAEVGQELDLVLTMPKAHYFDADNGAVLA